MNTIHVPVEICFDLDLFSTISQFNLGDFIFPVFKLVVDGSDLEYIVDYKNTEKTSVIYTIISKSGKFKPMKYQCISTDDFRKGAVVKLPPGEICGEEEERAYDAITFILFCMRYIMHYPRIHKDERISSHRYSQEYRTSTKQNRIYLFSDIVKYVSENYNPSEHHHEMQCPCWEVRGHYRHYKSGKTVFVKSFLKGKNKDTAQPMPKTYMAY